MLAELLGFTPDIDPMTPGAMVDVSNIVPTERGFAALESPIAVSGALLPAACFGAAKVRKLDDTKRTLAGTQTKIYELSGSAWNDVSRAAVYTTGPDSRWRFVQFGNATLCCNKSDATQVSISGAFADLAGSPKASICETVGGFVFLFDTNEATYGDSPDRWWCSGLYDYTTWTPSSTTQAATGRLMDTAGRVIGAKRLGQNMVAYKLRNMFLASYVGAPFIWSWQEIPGEIGAISHECIVSIGTEHIFISQDDFWRFDGVRPTPIGTPVRKWFFNRVDPKYIQRVQGLHDRQRKLVVWFYPSVGSNGVCDSWIAYHYKMDKWGAGSMNVESIIEYASNGMTFDNFGSLAASWDALPNIAYDSPFWISENPVAAVIDTAHQLNTITATPGAASMTSGFFGDDTEFTTLNKVRPRWLTIPSAANLTHYTADYAGVALSNHGSSALYLGAFNPLWSGRWHQIKLATSSGSFELAAVDLTLVPDGTQ
ncbi:hypothetical protein HQ393_04915 [Chitinibacter bivalviorum]|uniref:Uncharacterized protein n=1 Tax=Chitinibacter bivalviorum TaxID=2739434 RepID=A0A7H9BGC3_9NEIS|nr:hypothetical protein [Chitinibacter bivalviorum]QLG87647.1 hypothetical protein HQ393_04915 [Chitinibacter bivalviorum]